MVNLDSTTPEVSVVIPVYNGANYLHQAIESVLHQTYRNFEILVVDDGSKDDTWAIVEKYMATYPGVVRGIQQPNGGTSAALNRGILDGRGKYFAWLSHDDRFLPNKLEKQMQLLGEKPEIVGVYSDYARIDAVGQKICDSYCAWYPGPEKFRYLLWACFINGSTILIERRCLIEMGLFDVDLLYCQESMMWAKLAMRYELGYIQEPLTEYRVHSQQTTQTTKLKKVLHELSAWRKKALDAYTIQQIFPELNRPDVTPRDIAMAHYDLGRLLTYMVGERGLGYKQFWRAWWAWPDLHNPALERILRESRYWLWRTLRNEWLSILPKGQPLSTDTREQYMISEITDSNMAEIFATFKFAAAEFTTAKHAVPQ